MKSTDKFLIKEIIFKKNIKKRKHFASSDDTITSFWRQCKITKLVMLLIPQPR